jgi:predicted RNase H-like HicB family nuclease
MSRSWPVGREPKEVRDAAQQAIVTLEAALEQENALEPQPDESDESKQKGAGS